MPNKSTSPPPLHIATWLSPTVVGVTLKLGGTTTSFCETSTSQDHLTQRWSRDLGFDLLKIKRWAHRPRIELGRVSPYVAARRGPCGGVSKCEFCLSV